MILNALCDYYDLLSEIEGSEISPFGFEKVKVNYAAILTEEGKLLDILSLKDLNDNQSQSFLMPKSMKKPAISSSPVCDNFEYIFGVGGKKGEKTIEEKKFKTAKDLHLKMFADSEGVEARAIKKFFDQWEIEKAWENEHVLKHHSEKGNAFSGNIVFKLSDAPTYFHQVAEIVQVWENQNLKNVEEKGIEKGQCSISGEVSRIARLHDKLQGVNGASTTGASLVCFNKDADESYGLKQSRNSCVSEGIAFKYHTALQYMLSDRDRKIQIGDATTVFWADKKEKEYTNVFISMMTNPDDFQEDQTEEDIKTRNKIKTILKDGSTGIYNDAKLDPETRFYILGLSPNAGRLSVRFFYRDSFGQFCDRIKEHYDDIAIYGGIRGKEHIGLWSLLYATVSKNSRDKKVNPLLGGAVARSIFTGQHYPQVLLNQTIIRIKAEAFITQARAGIIKGYLIRKNRKQKKREELTMYLNEKSTKPAYVLGRVFAILEMIQKNALGSDINATIKDKYFASACSNPALVFPNLLKLTQHHLAKINKKDGIGGSKYWEIQLSNCISLLESDSFPKIMDLENQGRFILGYYQQTQKNYEKKVIKNNEESKKGE